MWVKILCVVVIASGALGSDSLLQPLYGQRGRNRLAVCVQAASGLWRRCDAALFTRECAVARAACLRRAPSDRMTLVRLSAGGSCDDIANGHSIYSSRKVRMHVLHPWFDLAVVVANTPYNDLDQLDNSTETISMLKPHNMYNWMEHYFTHIAQQRDQVVQITRIAMNLKTYHHPIWFFLTTMVIPSVLFMLFFIYIIFYTGSSQEIPYKKMHYSKRVTQV